MTGWTVDLALDLTLDYDVTPGHDAPRLHVTFEDDAGTAYWPVTGGVEPGAVRVADARVPSYVASRWVDLAEPGRATARVTAWRAERDRRMTALVAHVRAHAPVARADLPCPPGHRHVWVQHLLLAGRLRGGALLEAVG